MARPASLNEALTLLARHADRAKLLAGGQTLVPVLNFRLATPGLLIDLNTVRELAGIRLDGEVLRIGAMTRQAELLRNPLIAQHAPLLFKAAPHIGHVQTRSRGTLGGSLAHADPAAELPLVMVALDATFTLRREKAERSIPARKFFLDAMTTALRSDELLTEIAVPVAPAGTRTSFRELSRRHGDFALVAVAVQRLDDHLTVAVGGLEAVPRYWCEQQGILQDLKEAVALSDVHASADYRRHLASVLVQDGIDEVMAA